MLRSGPALAADIYLMLGRMKMCLENEGGAGNIGERICNVHVMRRRHKVGTAWCSLGRAGGQPKLPDFWKLPSTADTFREVPSVAPARLSGELQGNHSTAP